MKFLALTLALLLPTQALADRCDPADAECLQRLLLEQVMLNDRLHTALKDTNELNDALALDKQKCAKELKESNTSLAPGIWIGVGAILGFLGAALIIKHASP